MRIRLHALLLLPLTAVVAFASNENIVTAVFSGTYNGYQRQKATDGSFKTEYYALANGIFSAGLSADASIDKVKFPQVAGLVAQFLALRNYRLAPDSKQVDFVLIISWGKTIPSSDAVSSANMSVTASAFNDWKGKVQTLKALELAEASGGQGVTRGADGAASKERMLAQDAENDFQNDLYEMKMFQEMRRHTDEHNAKLLGYVDEINRGDTPARFAGLGTNYDELISDIENERYYFVISAYDFKTAKEGKRKLLWATRVSVQAQGNRFNEAAALMLSKASRYFGQNSDRLVREFDREGKVSLGELQVVGVVPQSQINDRPAEKK
jgi:hypothetical protein